MDYCLNFREARDMDPVTRNVVVAWVQRNRTVFPVAPKSFDEKVLAFVDALLARIDALTAQRMEPTCACGHEEERVMEQEWCCTQHLVKIAEAAQFLAGPFHQGTLLDLQSAFIKLESALQEARSTRSRG
jgi:hypothetical protein